MPYSKDNNYIKIHTPDKENQHIGRDSSIDSNLNISIIIPAYNEEKRITKCITRTLQYCVEQKWDFELIVAVDGSTDETARIVESFRSKDSRVKLVIFKERLGKGGALINAIKRANNQYIAYMDADLSADPSELQRLLEEIDDYDIVLGSRILRGNLPPIKRPMVRSFFSHIYSNAFRLLFKLQIYDPQCGLKVFRREKVLKILPEIKITGFAFDSELLVLACMLGLRIKEVPINWRHDQGSKIDIIKQTTVMGSDLLLIWKKLRSLQHTNKQSVVCNAFLQRKSVRINYEGAKTN
jgi:glycosyltransferase involved in cell wall biosynthesis